MDALESFRREWNDEISNRSLGNKAKSSDSVPSPELAEVGLESEINAAFKPKTNVCQEGIQDGDDAHGNRVSIGVRIPLPSTSHNTQSMIKSLSSTKDVSPSNSKEMSELGFDRSKTYAQTQSKRRQLASERSTAKKMKIMGLKDLFWERKEGEIPEENLLDKLIADIDEITAIPFFDISLPKEVAIKIFQHLNIKDLCSCAQVSKSWQMLAQDELLWSRLCHRMGHETIYTTREKHNWKQIVQHNVERQRLLVSNWKGRVGKFTSLEHAKGKILCCVDSYQDIVVAGYTNGDVKLWDLGTEDSCIFQPSSTSLFLDDGEGTLENIVVSVVTSPKITAASYLQGNVDIWSLESGTQPVQTYKPDKSGHGVPALCISQDGSMLCVSYSKYIDLLQWEPGSEAYSMIQHVENEENVRHVKLFTTDNVVPDVMFAKTSTVNLYHSAQPDVIGSQSHMTTIHDQIYAPIETIDFKSDQSVLGVALSTYSTVKLYEIRTCRLLGILDTGSWVTCMNLQQSPLNEFVTGARDRKVRVYDQRHMKCVQTFLTHGCVQRVQMDDWKVVSGGEEGYICVWDRRMNTKLWEWHNRHPVSYLHFHDKDLIVGNVATTKFPVHDVFECTTHKRYRGSVQVYNFLEDLTTRDVPEICLSTYDQPDASRHNIGLAVPYDALHF